MYAADRVTLRYGLRPVLDAVSLAIHPGEVVVLAGANGAGKSTLLRALAGDLAPTSGSVRLDGADIARMRPAALAARRGVLPQASSLAFPFTVLEVVRLGSSSRSAIRSGVAETMLERVDLAGFGPRLFQELSGGERQRVHLARVLCQVDAPGSDAPRYLLLDEPTTGLDLRHQLAILDIARGFAAKGNGVLAILHDLNLAAMVADRIGMLAGGKLLALGPPAEVVRAEILARAFGIDAEVGVAPPPPAPFVLPQRMRPA